MAQVRRSSLQKRMRGVLRTAFGMLPPANNHFNFYFSLTLILEVLVLMVLRARLTQKVDPQVERRLHTGWYGV